jgi:hypothetical protein
MKMSAGVARKTTEEGQLMRWGGVWEIVADGQSHCEGSGVPSWASH